MAIRVAIFEDNKLIRDSFEAILNGTEGFICAGSFTSCNNLLLDLQKSMPNTVLMDIEMSGINGIEATRMIKAHDSSIRILIQTVFDDDDKIFDAICAGASGYILKSAGPVAMIAALNDIQADGAPMSPGVATKVLRLFQKFAPEHSSSGDAEGNSLSKREKEILQLMTEGDNFHTIASRIFLSYETVRTHVRNIYKKLHVTSVNEAIVKAIKKRII